MVAEPVFTTPAGLTELLQDRPASFQVVATYASSYALDYGVVPGLTLSSAGVLSGTPTIAGTTPLTVRALTANPGVYKDKAFTALVETTPAWNTTTLSPFGLGLAGATAFDATGAVQYSLQSGALPPGVTLAMTGLLSGTATALGTFSFTVRAAKASATNSTDRAFTLLVTDLPAWATPAALTDVPAAVAYSLTLQATNAASYSLQSGALPGGVSLNTSTGALTGTPVSGSYNFRIRAVRTGAPNVYAERDFSLIVAISPTWVTGSALNKTAQSVAFSLQLQANDVASTGYTVIAGSPPAGVSVSTAGVLSGTPAGLETATFTVRARSVLSAIVYAERVFTITTVPLPVWTTASSLTEAVKGDPFSLTLAATNALTYAVKAGSTLPAGLTLTGAVLAGSATVINSYSFTITATGDAANAQTDRNFTLAVTSGIATLTVSTATWPLGGVSSVALAAIDGAAPSFLCTFQSNGGVCYKFSFNMARNGVRTAFTMTQPFGSYTYGGASGTNQNGGWSPGSSRSIGHSIVGSNFVLDLSNTPRNSPSSVSIQLPFTWQTGDLITELDIHAVAGQSTTMISASTNMKNAPAVPLLNYVPYRGVKGGNNGVAMFIGADGNVYGCGDNSTGRITGVVGASTNLLTQVPGLSSISRLTQWAEFPGYAQNNAGVWYQWGPYVGGSLGDGSASSGVTTPRVWSTVPNIVRMVTSRSGSYAMNAAGSWYYWGSNGNGELGSGAGVVATPTLLTAYTNVKNIVSTDLGFLFLLDDGSLYGSGSLNLSSSNQSSTTRVLIMTGVKDFIESQAYSTAIFVRKADNSIWCWGTNINGSLCLGNATTVYSTSPVRHTAMETWTGGLKNIMVSPECTLVLSQTGVVTAFGLRPAYSSATGTELTGAVIPGLPPISYIYGIRGGGCIFVTETLDVWTSGTNTNWQTGFNSGASRDATLLTTSFVLAPISISPTWATPAGALGITAGTVYKRLFAADAGTYLVYSGVLPAGVTLSNDGLLSGSYDGNSSGTFVVRAYAAVVSAFSDRAFTF